MFKKKKKKILRSHIYPLRSVPAQFTGATGYTDLAITEKDTTQLDILTSLETIAKRLQSFETQPMISNSVSTFFLLNV